MNRNLSIAMVCVLVLTIGSIAINPSVAQSSILPNQINTDQDMSHWKQVNIDGFGQPYNGAVLSLEIFNNQLYAASASWQIGALVWRLEPNGGWNAVSEPGFGSAYGNKNPAIPDMVVFNGRLFAGTAWGGTSAQLWSSPTGSTWNQVIADGFGNANNVLISPFGIFNDTLYVGTENLVNGLEIWRSPTGDSGDWASVVTGGNGNTNNAIVTGFTQFGTDLYAAVENTATGCEIWRTSNGTSWSIISSGGFGDPNNIQTGGLSIFMGYLYVGTRNNVTGAQLFRSANGTDWEPVNQDGFGDVNNYKIEMVFQWNGSLFAGTDNNLSGVEIWHSADGLTWKQVNTDGFGDTNNRAVLWNSSAIEYNHRLYIGMENIFSGGEIWKNLGYPLFLPLIQHY